MDYSGKKALIMGLGLHGGGLASARFLLERGAEVTVTDLRDEETLRPSTEQLDTACRETGGKPVRYVLGKHEIKDFQEADFVVKNPGVRPDSPFLQAAKSVETDLSLFLAESPARLFAVTGTKGKSGTSSALHWILKEADNRGKSYLGGNITVSPLSFLDKLTKNDNVVLELSSFQLGDLKGRKKPDSSPLLKPAAAILTAIMADHLDRYASMKEYIDDKRNIYREQDENDITVMGDCFWGESFSTETKARPVVYSAEPLPPQVSGGWLEDGLGKARIWNCPGISDKTVTLVPSKLRTPGEHQKINFLSAALAAYGMGLRAEDIFNALETFPGVEHRLEFFHSSNGVSFYNDSAATIPEAAAACIEALSGEAPLVLVTGGTDKNLDFAPLVKTAAKAQAVILLAGTGSDKLKILLDDSGIPYSGPFDNLDEAVKCAVEKAAGVKTDSGCTAALGCNVAMSPGCASFGMFLNEFDRGRKWKDACLRLA